MFLVVFRILLVIFFNFVQKARHLQVMFHDCVDFEHQIVDEYDLGVVFYDLFRYVLVVLISSKRLDMLMLCEQIISDLLRQLILLFLFLRYIAFFMVFAQVE